MSIFRKCCVCGVEPPRQYSGACAKCDGVYRICWNSVDEVCRITVPHAKTEDLVAALAHEARHNKRVTLIQRIERELRKRAKNKAEATR